ncbi:MAG: hypothetical protein ACRCX8_18510 [Sarcina sp.]
MRIRELLNLDGETVTNEILDVIETHKAVEYVELEEKGIYNVFFNNLVKDEEFIRVYVK